MTGARGPDDCGLVYLVGSDAELAARLMRLWVTVGRGQTRDDCCDVVVRPFAGAG